MFILQFKQSTLMHSLDKLLIPIIFVTGTAYGPLELSRYICAWPDKPEFQAELVFMWAFYLGAIVLLIIRELRKK